MKWIGIPLFLATATCTFAEPQDPSPLIQQLQGVLQDGDNSSSDLVKRLIGEENANRYFYFPTHDTPATPQKWGFEYEDVYFKSGDETQLHGWFIPAKKAPAKGTIVFSHGNAGSLGHHLGFVLWLAEAQYNVFMYDYRGFGKSKGELDRAGMIEDVTAAFNYVSKRPDINPSKLISYGHSLGGAKSITALAKTHQPGLQAIIADGAFASYQSMARVMVGQLGANLITDELSPAGYIKKIKNTPILIIHGDRDEVVPFSQGERLFSLANEPKTLFNVKDGRHGDSLSRDNGAYRKRLLKWLDGR